MPNFKKLFPSKYLKAADLDGEERELVIDRLEMEWIGQGNDAEEKPCLYFEDCDQSLVMNITNANSIATMYGDDYDQWGGKSITLYPTQVQFGSKMVDCIRVKMVRQQKLSQPKETEAVAVDGGSGKVPF